MAVKAKKSEAELRDRWVKRVQKEKKVRKPWLDQAKRAEAAYQDEKAEQNQDSGNPFPIFWSTVQITHAAIFAKTPKPDVRKRYTDQGGSEDRLAQCVQRALEFTLDTTGFMDHAHALVDDYLIGALGQGKLELESVIADAPVIDPISQQPMTDPEGKPLLQKIIQRQAVRLRHFHWSKFGWEPGSDWESCEWVRFEHDMSAEEIQTRFGVTLTLGDAGGDASNLSPKKENAYQQTVCVQEIWDRKTKRQLFVTENHDSVLEVNDDPLGLENFFPCPRPIMLNPQPKQLMPKPDYFFIRKQCENIQRLSQRVQMLTRNIKDVGFYDAQLSELGQLNNSEDGTLIPVKNLMERLNKASKADFEQVVAQRDNTTKVVVLRELVAQRDVEKNALFETLGIADIVRGSSQASETAAAQKIKSQWANVRISRKVQGIAVFFRDVFRIMAEIIAEHFEPEQLAKMTAMPLQPQELAVLKQDLARGYAIDVETDSTLAQDDTEEKNQRLEMVRALTDYLNVYLPLAQQNLIPASMVKQTLLFVVRSFKYGRNLEEAINQMPETTAQLQQLQQALQQCQQQLQQAQEQLQAQGQQAQQMISGLQAQVQQGDARKEQREDAKATADIHLKEAQTQKTLVDASMPRMPNGHA